MDSASFDVSPRPRMIKSPHSSRLRCTAREELLLKRLSPPDITTGEVAFRQTIKIGRIQQT
jgi:hypothetical protein